MRNLHEIINSNTALDYWENSTNTRIPINSMATNHISNILERYSARYMKGNVRGERKAMFEGVVKEWHRRFPHYG